MLRIASVKSNIRYRPLAASKHSSGHAGWLGCFNDTGSEACIEAFGYPATYQDTFVSCNGATTVSEIGEQTVVLCGDVILDNAIELSAQTGRTNASHLQILADLVASCGTDAIRSARGMYAVAAWFPDRKELLLLRDSAGARTLYYAKKGCAIWFGNTLRAVQNSPAGSSDICLSALRNYLTCAYVPGEETMWRSIREVGPGSAVTVSNSVSSSSASTIWRPSEGDWDTVEPIESAATRLRPLLEDAVSVCMPASENEDVGVYLSGGLDSSLVTALAARMSARPVYTYAIHFGKEYRNELEWSGMVASHCKTRHRVIELPGKQIRDNLEASIAALDDPIGDPLTTPNLILGRTAAQDVKTILNGEGGDPCFGGPKNLPMALHALYSDGNRESAYLRAYQKCYDDLPSLLSISVQHELRRYPPQEEFFSPFFGPESGMKSYLNRLMLMNTLLKGADNILTKVNNLTTVNGLIGRSPLFDRRLVEASFAIPPEFKQAGAVEKAILKRAVADLLPEAILNRPKSGMLVPVQGWFKKDLKRMARGMMLGRQARIRPYLNQQTIKEWLAYRGNLWPRHGVKLWLALTLEIWLRCNE